MLLERLAKARAIKQQKNEQKKNKVVKDKEPKKSAIKKDDTITNANIQEQIKEQLKQSDELKEVKLEVKQDDKPVKINQAKPKPSGLGKVHDVEKEAIEEIRKKKEITKKAVEECDEEPCPFIGMDLRSPSPVREPPKKEKKEKKDAFLKIKFYKQPNKMMVSKLMRTINQESDSSSDDDDVMPTPDVYVHPVKQNNNNEVETRSAYLKALAKSYFS